MAATTTGKYSGRHPAMTALIAAFSAVTSVLRPGSSPSVSSARKSAAASRSPTDWRVGAGWGSGGGRGPPDAGGVTRGTARGRPEKKRRPPRQGREGGKTPPRGAQNGGAPRARRGPPEPQRGLGGPLEARQYG